MTKGSLIAICIIIAIALILFPLIVSYKEQQNKKNKCLVNLTIFKSIKLDKTLYSDNKNFGEAAIYFAGLIMF